MGCGATRRVRTQTYFPSSWYTSTASASSLQVSARHVTLVEGHDRRVDSRWRDRVSSRFVSRTSTVSRRSRCKATPLLHVVSRGHHSTCETRGRPTHEGTRLHCVLDGGLGKTTSTRTKCQDSLREGARGSCFPSEGGFVLVGVSLSAEYVARHNWGLLPSGARPFLRSWSPFFVSFEFSRDRLSCERLDVDIRCPLRFYCAPPSRAS